MSVKDHQKIKIKDVAEIAGVSVGTVDRVMHNRGEVAEETKAKVLNAINELQYIPNMIARSLALKKKFRFAVLLPESNTHNDYWYGPLQGIKNAAEELDTYKLDVDIQYFNQSDSASFQLKANQIINSNPDGFIFPPLFEELAHDAITQCRKLNVPFSIIDSNLDIEDKVSFIGQNSFQSGYLAGKLIHQFAGRKSGKFIVLLMEEGASSAQVNKRTRGFLDYFQHNDEISSNRVVVLRAESRNFKTLKEFLIQHFNQNSDISGVFIPNSRSYLFCELVDKDLVKNVCVIGYDLLEKNITCLENERIHFLIAQNPSKQGYKAVMDLFDHIVLKKEVKKESFIPIDIIIKENYRYYLD